MKSATIPQIYGLATSSGASGATVTIPDGIGQTTLVVLDKITGSVINGSAGAATINLTYLGQDVNRQSAIASQVVNFDVSFNDGLPCWAATGSDLAVRTSNTVTLGTPSATGSFTTLLVVYHYEDPATRRG